MRRAKYVPTRDRSPRRIVAPAPVARAARRTSVKGSSAAKPNVLSPESILDLQRHVASAQDQILDLTLTEFKMLAYLMNHPDRVISPRELVAAVQGYEADEHEARAIVRVHIRRLRQKIEPDPDQPQHVLNVRGVGYLFAASDAS